MEREIQDAAVRNDGNRNDDNRNDGNRNVDTDAVDAIDSAAAQSRHDPAAAESTLRIVEAGENDADLVAIMVQELLREIRHEWHNPPREEQIMAVSRELLAEDARFTALIAFEDRRRPVGVMTLTEAVALYAGGRFGIIMELFVAPETRSLGIGEKLIEAAKGIGAERGWSLLEVNAPGDNARGRVRGFYERAGFISMGAFLKLAL